MINANLEACADVDQIDKAKHYSTTDAINETTNLKAYSAVPIVVPELQEGMLVSQVRITPACRCHVF